MKKSFSLLMLGLIVVLASCSEHNDTSSPDRVVSFGKLEKTILEKTINDQITSLNAIVDAMTSYDYIKSMTELPNGYKFDLTSGKSFTVDNGEKSADGTIPIIGVKADVDGLYYWTLKKGNAATDWITDNNGKKLIVSSSTNDGNVFRPKVRVNAESNFWELSCDNAVSWKSLDIKAISATGSVSAGGGMMISKVETIGKKVCFKLATGDELTIKSTGDIVTNIYIVKISALIAPNYIPSGKYSDDYPLNMYNASLNSGYSAVKAFLEIGNQDITKGRLTAEVVTCESKTKSPDFEVKEIVPISANECIILIYTPAYTSTPALLNIVYTDPGPKKTPYVFSRKVISNSVAEATEVNIWMLDIPIGTFIMGSYPPEKERSIDLEQLHRVTLTKKFRMSDREITAEQYAAFLTDKKVSGNGLLSGLAVIAGSGQTNLKYDGSKWSGSESSPALGVTFYGAKQFCAWLGTTYDLPTESEWEYAATGQYANKNTNLSTTPFGSVKYPNDLCYIENSGLVFNYKTSYNVTTGEKTDPSKTSPDMNTPVFGTRTNRYLGVGVSNNNYNLYGMIGGAAEWVLDKYDPTAYTYTKPDPLFLRGTHRILRGGSWASNAKDCRSAARQLVNYDDYTADNTCGFRIVQHY